MDTMDTTTLQVVRLAKANHLNKHIKCNSEKTMQQKKNALSVLLPMKDFSFVVVSVVSYAVLLTLSPSKTSFRTHARMVPDSPYMKIQRWPEKEKWNEGEKRHAAKKGRRESQQKKRGVIKEAKNPLLSVKTTGQISQRTSINVTNG